MEPNLLTFSDSMFDYYRVEIRLSIFIGDTLSFRLNRRMFDRLQIARQCSSSF